MSFRTAAVSSWILGCAGLAARVFITVMTIVSFSPTLTYLIVFSALPTAF